MSDDDLGAAYRAAVGLGRNDFQGTVGYLVEVERDHARIRLEVTDRHLNPYGSAHGGVTLTLLDTAGGVQVYLVARPLRMATINMATQFLEAVPPGLVVATATIDRLGKAVAQARMELRQRNSDGPLLATAVASYRLFHAR